MTAIFLMALAFAPGEDIPDTPVKPPMVNPKSTPQTRKAVRDEVLRAVGKEAMPFTKRYGDNAIYALQKCTPATGKRLVGMSGDLAKLKSPQAALRVVREVGEPAAVFLIEHMEQLADPFCLAAWVKEPEEFLFELKDLEAEGIRLRSNYKANAPPPIRSASSWSGSNIAMGFLLAMVGGGIFWLRRRIPS